ncbi:hypothetical protein CPB85DRAFT_1348303 [Mucidula mucida]|nr:hypothetical protein CPB85DRAFT_1348303 [Mucidula mucida]
MAAVPQRKTFDEVFPLTLPADATPSLENTLVEGYVTPWYALGWTFEEYELWRQLAKQQEWNKRWNVFSDSQSKWINPRWNKYSNELPLDVIDAATDVLLRWYRTGPYYSRHWPNLTDNNTC